MRCKTEIAKILLGLFVSATVAAWAQTSSSTGALQGVVQDPSGAAVSGATVTLINSQLNVRRQTTSAADGTFVFPLIQPGNGYEVDVEHTGFDKAQTTGLAVRVTEVTNDNVQLKLGSVSQQVTVSGTQTAIQTANATLGSTLTTQVVTSIPLASRSVIDLLGTDAGVAATISSPASTILQGGTAIFVGGGRDTANDYTINGIDANNFEFHTLSLGIIPVPNPDAVQEFRTQTSLYDASIGFSGGGSIALITRSGTAQYHGTLYEFLRNTIFNANDFFFNRDGSPRPTLIQNQFGGSVGGPVPKFHNTFFFFNYEGQRQANGIAGGTSGFLPVLPAQRTAATLAALYNLPIGAIDPVAVNILNQPGPYGGRLFPSGVNAPAGELGTFAFSAPVHLNSNQYNARVDHDFNTGSVANHIYVAYFDNPNTFTNNGGVNSGTLGQAYDYDLSNQTLSIQDTQILRPNLLNEITAGFTYARRDINAIHPVTAAQLGIIRYNTSIYPLGPNFDFSDQLSCCGASASVNERQRSESQNYRDILSWVHGAQTFRFGFEARPQQFNFGSPLDPGTLVFIGGIADSLYGPPTDPLKDLSVRDFLVGAPFEISIGSGLTDFQYRAHDFGAFAQDDYRMTPRLTLNLGLRWDYLGNITEKHNLISNFDPSLISAQTALVGGPGLQAGFVLPSGAPKGFGTPGVSKSTMLHQPYGDFAPRLGFADDVLGNGKLAVRGGFGVYWMRMGGFQALQTVSNPPFSLSTVTINTTKAQLLHNPFPTLPFPSQFPIFTPFPMLTSLNPDGSPNFTQPQLFVTAIDRHETDPYTQQYNLTTQYEFLPGWTVEVGYMGTHGVKLEGAQSANNALLRNSSNPGTFGIANNSAANRESRVPIIGINSGGLFYESNYVKSNYNALLLTLSHQFSRGLYFKAAYTHSKSLDNQQNTQGFESSVGPTGNQFDPSLNYGLSNFDIPNRLVLTYVYDLPGPKEGLARQVLGGWAWSGITILQNGFAGEIDQYTGGNSFSGTDGYGVVIPGCKLVNGGIGANGQYLNPNCATTTAALTSGQTFGPLTPQEVPGGSQFYQVDPNTPGAIGYLQGRSTRGAFFNPFESRWDMALSKTFPLAFWGPDKSLQFRAESFKIFNTPIFNGPNGTAGLPGFGRITSTIDNTGRQLQFALRLTM